MSDEKKHAVIPSRSNLPAVSPPAPSLPSLPTGNSVHLFEYRRYENNTRTVNASANLMRARAHQHTAFGELLTARENLALAIARLHALPERCAHQHEMGRRTRRNELELLKLEHERTEVEAQILVASAQLRLAGYIPQPQATAPAAPPPAPVGLSPADVEKVAQTMPELKPDTIQSLVWALGGLLAEKNK